MTTEIPGAELAESTHCAVTRADQLRHGANFELDGKLYLVRCVACGGDRGTENWAPAVSSGSCAWCGWEEPQAAA